jgi:hypothetical protein
MLLALLTSLQGENVSAIELGRRVRLSIGEVKFCPCRQLQATTASCLFQDKERLIMGMQPSIDN